MTSVLLVEIIVSDQFPRAVTFPFIQGFLRERGVTTRWLRFGSPQAVRARPGESGIPLPPGDLEALAGLIRAGAPPSHVLLSHEPAPGLRAALNTGVPGARIGWVCDQVSHGPGDSGPVFPDAPSVAAFADLPPHDGGVNLFEEAVPDFSFEAGNPEAASAPPLPFLFCGPGCSYRRGLDTNPFFAGVDLSGCDDRGGCTFCVRPVHDVPWTRPAEDVMSRQLDAVARAWRGSRERLLVRAVGETFLERIETFAALVASRPLPACDFLLDGRADLLLAREAHLEEALRVLRPTRHCLHIALVGIENFSDTELLRMNKGTTGVRNLDLVRLLLRLEREYPSTFAFRRWGGLSLILFTPWTRPQDLAFNLSVLEMARIERFAGKVFSGRLRLVPGLPLHRLAERDGLLVEAYDDPRLDPTRSNSYPTLYPDDTPWRFQDSRMGSVCRVIVRMATPPVRGDPMDEAMGRAFQRLGETSYGIGFALGVVDAAVAADRPLDPVGLVEETARLRGPEGRDWIRDASALPGRPLDPSLAVRFTAMAVRIGVKPVARLEGDADAFPGVKGLVVAPRMVGETRIVFLGRERRLIEQAVEAARRQGDPGTDAGSRQEALLEEARLLGYPECCARAFAAREGEARDPVHWLRIQRRIEADDEVSPLFHPGYLPLVKHVPCSLACPESLSRAQRLLDAWRHQEGEEAARDLLRSLSRPWLFLTEADGHRVELIPEEEPGERFRYRPGLWAGAHPLVRAVLDGDEVVVDDAGLAILRHGRLRAALGCRAFLWWHRRVFHRDLWARLIALRFDPRRDPDLEERREETAPEDPATAERARRLAAFVAAALTRDVNDFEGFRVASIEPWSGVSVRLTLRSPHARLTLVVEPWSPSRAAFQRVGPLAVLHPDGEPLDTPAKVRAARLVASRLKAALDRRPARR